MWCRNMVVFPGGPKTKVFGEKEEIEYDKQRDNKDGRTTVINKGSYSMYCKSTTFFADTTI